MSNEHLHNVPPEENPDIGYELRDANVTQVVIAGLGLAAATALACVAMYFMFNLLRHGSAQEQTINPMAGPRVLPPEPRLQEKPWEQHMNLTASEDQVLSSYGWVDKPSGKVRIPVEKALDIVAQRGPDGGSVQAQPATSPASGAGGPKNSATPGGSNTSGGTSAQQK
jgi:hypothetical protein